MKKIFFFFFFFLPIFLVAQDFRNTTFNLRKHLPEDKKALLDAYRARDFIVDKLPKLKGTTTNIICLSSPNGAFKKGKCEKAVCIMKSGKEDIVYCGPAYLSKGKIRMGVSVNSRKNVKGTILKKNGQFFHGTIPKKSSSLNGILVYSGQKYYIGDLHNGEPYGNGKMVTDGFLNEGDWSKGIPKKTDAKEYSVDCTQAEIDIAIANQKATEAKERTAATKERIVLTNKSTAEANQKTAEAKERTAEANERAAQNSLKEAKILRDLDAKWEAEIKRCGFKHEVELILTGAYQGKDASKQLNRLMTNSKLKASLGEIKLLLNGESEFLAKKASTYAGLVRKRVGKISFDDIQKQEPKVRCVMLEELVGSNSGLMLDFRNLDMKLVKVIFLKKDGDKYELIFMKNPRSKKISIIDLELLNK